MITDGYLKRLAKIESSDNPLAKNPKSSAKGRYQFIDSTAKQYGITAEFGTPEYEAQERDAVIKFTTDNYNHLEKKLGRKPTNGELYLAHQQGAAGAVRLLSNPDARAVDVLGEDQVKLNGGTGDMTLGEFGGKWTDKFADLDEQQHEVAPVNLYEMLDVKTGESIKKKPLKQSQGSGVNLYDILEVNPTEDIKDDLLYRQDGGTDRINKEAGAPAYVRAIVGSVFKPEDKLNTLREYYPDAEPYDGNNFIYTDPDTGEKNLYNPKGLDTGDIASVAREGVQTIGGFLGGAAALVGGQLGPQIATPEEFVTMPLAAGFGSAMGGQAFDTLLSVFGLKVDTRTPLQKVTEAGVDVAAGAAGEAVGAAAGSFIKKAVTGVRDTGASQRLVNMFKEYGIRPTAGTAAGSRGAMIEAGLEKTIGGVDVLEKQAEDVISQTQSAVSKLVAEVGDARTKQGAGDVIQDAAQAAADRFKFTQNKVYEEAFDLVGSDTMVDVASIKKLHKEVANELSAAQNSLKGALSSSLEMLDNIIADSAEGGLSFKSLRQIRTSIGRDLKAPQLIGSSGSQNDAMKRVYGALTQDMSNAAASVSPEAARKTAVADRYTRTFMNNSKKILDKIDKFDASEKAYKFVLTSSRDGGSALSQLRSNFTPEEWDVVAASVLNDMGKATAGRQGAVGDDFSVNSFMTNWNKIAPEAKDALFGGKRYAPQRKALNDLTEIMESLKGAGRFENTSNTSSSLNVMMLMQVLGAGTVGLAAGDGTGLATGLVGGILAPRYAAKLITNPNFIEWMAAPAAKGFADMPGHIAKLSAIGAANPEIKEAIYEYSKVLEENTKD